MEYKKFDIITLKNNSKLVVLEILEHEGITYLYVDKVNEEETDNLGEYQIYKVCENNVVQKETNTDILISILPLFSKNIKLNQE